MNTCSAGLHLQLLNPTGNLRGNQITFYKKGKNKLAGNIQRDLKYRRKDTVNFLGHNHVSDQFFHENRASFLGICTGVDSSITVEGTSSTHKWLQIHPSKSLSTPPKPEKDQFGIESYDSNLRRWNDKNDDILSTVPLSNEFYVNAADVQLTNNDSIFR